MRGMYFRDSRKYSIIYRKSGSVKQSASSFPRAEFLFDKVHRFKVRGSSTKMKGSDASWFDNHEPPEYALDYSDDEQERAAKRKNRAKRPWESAARKGPQNQDASPQKDVSVIKSTENRDLKKEPENGIGMDKSSNCGKTSRRRRSQKKGCPITNCASEHGFDQSQTTRQTSQLAQKESNRDTGEEHTQQQDQSQGIIGINQSKQGPSTRRENDQSNFDAPENQNGPQTTQDFSEPDNSTSRNRFNAGNFHLSPRNPFQLHDSIANNPFNSNKSANVSSPANFPSNPVCFPPPPRPCFPPNLPNSTVNFPPSRLNPQSNPVSFPPLDTSKPPPQFSVPPNISAPAAAPSTARPDMAMPFPMFLPPPSNTPSFGQPPVSNTAPFGQPPPLNTPAFGQPSFSCAPTFGQPSPCTPSFSQPPPSNTPSFGQPPPSNNASFGQPPPSNTAAFGQPPPSNTASFGQPPPSNTASFSQPPPSNTASFSKPPPTNTASLGQPPPSNTPSFGQPPPFPFGSLAQSIPQMPRNSPPFSLSE